MNEPARPATVVLTEAAGLLALVATRRLYDQQPRLWEMGEHGRARTLEDFGHHFRALATLDDAVFADHVRYCHELWARRGFPERWLTDAWRTIDAVLDDELPPAVTRAARRVLRSATSARSTT